MADTSSIKNRVRIYDSNGNPIIAGLVKIPYNAITTSYPTATTEVYQYRESSITSSILANVTIVYTTSDKDILSYVTYEET